VRFVVRDEGIGISPDAEKGLFQPFIQADSATSRRYDGSGLGLAICRRLCQLMGGDIAFEPPNGRGAMFSFHIPATRVELPVKESAAAQDEPGNARGLDVMVVDDNLANARLMNSILKRFGVAPRIAPGGREAIESYVANPPDLILMDIQMPEVDGFQAAREIRRIEAEGGLPRCRIIAVTADILENCRADALKAGMDGYLTKPVRIPDIQALVEQPWPAAAVA
jgi:CheY-like chemotaxis protein